ncbi:hypothetical protein Aph02nite_27850 [Actinoplanes philippinensis]|uniref:Predicted arabinose efflux permease, MFS family n=1 Tax=Actinoplanes philippinensis TaxID=35752 RepID=A0A1I2GCG3_9ACTN|nr:MFS transporter [Actinoplanes philippinensis]GIE76835.1 hypothetical protein Aph02nite_27850 [Actinoplanes philippinensis]SFF15275.1 Predicted arabinose efflux permease, MFS family [Actinoplanes philippinensis]
MTGVSYLQVLRSGRLAGVIAGDAAGKLGDGMLFVALPLLALQMHGSLRPAAAVSIVISAPYVLAMALSLYFGAGRRRFDARLVVAVDGVLRAVAFGVLGLVADAGRISFGWLVTALAVGSGLRLMSTSGRRLLATGMAGERARLSVNGLLGTSDSLAMYVVGPALGGVLAAVTRPGIAVAVGGCAYLSLIVCAALARNASADTSAPTRSGWSVLRRNAVAYRLLVVDFLFNLFYGPVEVALPLLVTADLGAGAGALGTLWTCFGAGALTGAVLTGQLRRFPPQATVVVIIGGWAAAMVLLAVAAAVPVAAVALIVGGVVYGPFLAVAYTFLQDNLDDEDQQPVLTIYAAGIALAAPLGLGVGGPVVTLLGARGGIAASALVTAVLAPAVWWWIKPRAAR